MVKALVHRAQGSLEDANSTLLEALTLAEPEGYIRIFLDEGEPMRLLISDFRFQIENRMRQKDPNNQKTFLDYIQKLLVGFTLSSVRYTRKSSMTDQPSSLPEPLSERELEILRLMAAGLSNRDIADMDVVSINTVKTQVKSIFGKLGVHHREEAIATARELRLI